MESRGPFVFGSLKNSVFVPCVILKWWRMLCFFHFLFDSSVQCAEEALV